MCRAVYAFCATIEKPLNARLRCDNNFHRKVMNYTMRINYDVKSSWVSIIVSGYCRLVFFIDVRVANCIAFVDLFTFSLNFVCFLRRSKIAGRANILVFFWSMHILCVDHSANRDNTPRNNKNNQNSFLFTTKRSISADSQFFLSNCFRRCFLCGSIRNDVPEYRRTRIRLGAFSTCSHIALHMQNRLKAPLARLFSCPCTLDCRFQRESAHIEVSFGCKQVAMRGGGVVIIVNVNVVIIIVQIEESVCVPNTVQSVQSVRPCRLCLWTTDYFSKNLLFVMSSKSVWFGDK